MASLLVVLIIIGCSAYQYVKGNVVKVFATIIVTLSASVVAFGFFEFVAGFLTSKSDTSRLASIIPWAQCISFIILFVLTFAVLQTLVNYLSKQKIDFGFLPERIGRIICGVILGIILSGNLLTAAVLAPLPKEYPYQRFEPEAALGTADADNPDKVFLNADGFVTGWFALLSRGPLKGNVSFAALHPNFLNEVFLNRHLTSEKITTIIPGTTTPIQVPGEKAVWETAKDKTDIQGNAIAPKSGYTLTTVRIGMTRLIATEKGKFTLSQLRLICKRDTKAQEPRSGQAINIYPVGYLQSAKKVKLMQLNEEMKLGSNNFDDSVKWIDFLFYVPDEYVPVFVRFKQKTILELPSPISTQDAPEPAFFNSSSED